MFLRPRIRRRFGTIAALALATALPVFGGSVKTDACRLLTGAEIARVQAGPVVETKATGRPTGGFVILDCFYRVEPFEKSVSLEVTRRGKGASAQNPRARWEKMFRGEGDDPAEDRSAEKEEKRAEPRPVPGVGDEAFWMSNPVSGALYVLKGSSYLRISVGGGDAESVKIEKTIGLARHALGRL
jgi:hypothetical protein